MDIASAPSASPRRGLCSRWDRCPCPPPALIPVPTCSIRRLSADHLDRLYRAAWALCGSREDAEDLVQEAFARVLRRPGRLRSDDDLGYLLRVLRNTYFSDRRAAKRRLAPDRLPDNLDLIEDRTAASPQAALEAGELYALIATLPDAFRETLVAVDADRPVLPRGGPRAARPRGHDHQTRLYRARLRLATALGGKDPAPEASR